MPATAAIPSNSPDVNPTSGERGLHLSWDTSFRPSGSSAFYAYPLGTGAAWAQPIELTRVYVVAPANLKLDMNFPRLGGKRAGYARAGSRYEPRILEYLDEPSYAVEQARTSYIVPSHGQEEVNIWRATYTHSNAAEDIIITVAAGGGGGLREWLRQGGMFTAFLIGTAAAALFWILSWYLLMPRLLGRKGLKGLWHRPFIYMAVNLALLIIPGVIILIVLSFGQAAGALLAAFVIFGLAGAAVFIIKDLNKLGASGTTVIRAFIVVTLASSGAYLLFALAYARLAGAV